MATRKPARRAASKKPSVRSSSGERSSNRGPDRDNDRGRDRDDNRDRGRGRDDKAEWTSVASLRESRRSQDILTGRVQEDKLEGVITRLQDILEADGAAQFVVNLQGKYGPFISLTQGEKYEARDGGGRGGSSRGGSQDHGRDNDRGRGRDRGDRIDEGNDGGRDTRDDRF